MSNKSKLKVKKIEPPPELRLDLACGRQKQSGFHGVDLYSPEADTKLDLFKFPWPWKDGAVTEIYCSHFVEHIPRTFRWPFFEECWRVLKDDGIMKVFVPNWKSERAFGDMSHVWPPVVAMAFFYLNENWRELNKLNYGYYDLKCNFDHQAGPVGVSPSFSTRAHEAQLYAFTHYLESYQDMWITLTKKPRLILKK
jgi:hypothetical protein